MLATFERWVMVAQRSDGLLIRLISPYARALTITAVIALALAAKLPYIEYFEIAALDCPHDPFRRKMVDRKEAANTVCFSIFSLLHSRTRPLLHLRSDLTM
jgi:hypothetical protein